MDPRSYSGVRFRYARRKVSVADCVSREGGGVWRWYCNEPTPSIWPPGVIMHRPARSNFLISPTVVTLISVGRTHHHRQHTSEPQVQGWLAHFYAAICIFDIKMMRWFRTSEKMGKGIRMKLSNYLGVDSSRQCVTRALFPVLLPDLGDSAVSASFLFLSHFLVSTTLKLFWTLTHLSAGLVVVKVHQADRVFRTLSAFPSVLCIHKSSREGDAKVNVVRTAGPLWKGKGWWDRWRWERICGGASGGPREWK